MQEQPDLLFQHAERTSWAFTLRKTSTKKGNPTQGDYDDHIIKLIANTEVSQTKWCFERKGGLHMHGILEIPRFFNMKRFRVRGWKMHLEEIYDLIGWHAYMAKEQLIKIHEDELSEQEHPVHRLRRSLFKTAIPLQLPSPNGVEASLPGANTTHPI